MAHDGGSRSEHEHFLRFTQFGGHQHTSSTLDKGVPMQDTPAKAD